MKIFYLMGKSASGKDTIYSRLRKESPVPLSRVILYTTRPMRSSEENGREYFFISGKEADELRSRGKIIEERVYQTAVGPWHYMTVDDGQLKGGENYLAIGTLASYEKLKAYFGEDQLVPIYLEIDDGLRLERALKRERALKEPLYEEMCRRFLADQEDFSEENLKKAGISRRYDNTDGEACLREILDEIRSQTLKAGGGAGRNTASQAEPQEASQNKPQAASQAEPQEASQDEQQEASQAEPQEASQAEPQAAEGGEHV